MKRVATAACCLGGLLLVAAGPAGASGSSGTWTFVTAPRLHPPKLRVLVRKPGLARGYFMVGDTPNPHRTATLGQGGPELMDNDTRPVWFLPSSRQTFDLQQETYRGNPVLVWYQGPVETIGIRRGGGSGRWLIYDEHYRRIATIKARSPWATDLHDASIIGGDIWITVNREVKHQNLSAYGGPRDGTVQDWGLQEFQISTGRLIRTWDPLNPGGKPSVPLSESHQPATDGWDAYHLNSVQALPDGDLLVSLRNTWSVYLIDPVKNRILWTLGGKRSTFHVAHGARFAWQHDAQLVDPSDNGHGRRVELTVFDDNSATRPAKGLILRLNTVSHRAELVQAYTHHPPYTAGSLGSMQVLPNGNALVDWGSPYAYFTEFAKRGKPLLDVAWPRVVDQSYRTLFTDTWVGTPYYPPSGAVRGTTVYASWNGATQVARWEVLAGVSPSDLKGVATQARDGFETAIKVGQSYSVYEVRALGTDGKVLRTSKPFS